MAVVRAVREIQAEDVDPGLDEAIDLLIARRSWSQRRHYLGLAHVYPVTYTF
jgi:hypothetical protein